MIYWIIIYLVGVVSAWFTIAWHNDKIDNEDYKYGFNKLPFIMILGSFIIPMVIILIFTLSFIFDLVDGKNTPKVFKPSLKYFKRKK